MTDGSARRARAAPGPAAQRRGRRGDPRRGHRRVHRAGLGRADDRRRRGARRRRQDHDLPALPDAGSTCCSRRPDALAEEKDPRPDTGTLRGDCVALVELPRDARRDPRRPGDPGDGRGRPRATPSSPTRTASSSRSAARESARADSSGRSTGASSPPTSTSQLVARPARRRRVLPGVREPRAGRRRVRRPRSSTRCSAPCRPGRALSVSSRSANAPARSCSCSRSCTVEAAARRARRSSAGRCGAARPGRAGSCAAGRARSSTRPCSPGSSCTHHTCVRRRVAVEDREDLLLGPRVELLDPHDRDRRAAARRAGRSARGRSCRCTAARRCTDAGSRSVDGSSSVSRNAAGGELVDRASGSRHAEVALRREADQRLAGRAPATWRRSTWKYCAAVVG